MNPTTLCLWANSIGILLCILLIAPGYCVSSERSSKHRCGVEAVQEKLKILPRSAEILKIEREFVLHTKRDNQTYIYVPVNYHILEHSDGRGEVDDNTLYWQTTILNGAFNKHGYYFYTRSINRVPNSDDYTLDCEDNMDAITQTYTTSPERIMNVYSCVIVGTIPNTDESVLGFTLVAGDLIATDPRNSVFILYSTFPDGSADYYNQGDTLVHETGHFLGLYHPFQGGCTEPNDEVSDTPETLGNTDITCDVTSDTCPNSPGYDDVKNYMDYSADYCLDHFTSDQNDRMNAIMAMYKPLFADNLNGSDPVMTFPNFTSSSQPSDVTGLSSWLTNIQDLL